MSGGLDGVPLHLRPVVEAIVAELTRQRESGPLALSAFVPFPIESALVEGGLDIVALARAVLFCPTGDNHHNAAACPHCSPPVSKESAP